MEASNNQTPHPGSFSSSSQGGRIVSFVSGSAGSSGEMFSMDLSRFAGASNMPAVVISSCPGTNSHMATVVQAGSFSGSAVHEPPRRLTHISGLPSDWTAQELEILNEGFARYSSEQSMKKYTKIAAMLPNKSIRDVALRCQWMTAMEKSKRKKPEANHAAKRTKSFELACSTSTSNSNKAYSDEMCPNPMMMHQLNSCNQFPSTDVQHRLGENILTLRQIANNLRNGQWQENAHLFLSARENITNLLHRVNMMPANTNQLRGSMKHLPPFPELINEELLSNIVSLNSNASYAASGNNDLWTGPSHLGPNIR